MLQFPAGIDPAKKNLYIDCTRKSSQFFGRRKDFFAGRSPGRALIIGTSNSSVNANRQPQ
jgi:hypothetical protein